MCETSLLCASRSSALTGPQTMLPLYAHDTRNTHVQTWADTHYAGRRVSGAATRGTMSLGFVIAFHSDFPLLRRQRKRSLMPLHMRNHDAFFPRALSYLRLGEKKKLYSQGKMAGGQGGPACQAFHGTQWTHYYDTYKAGWIDTA